MEEMKMDKLFLFRFAKAYFRGFIYQMEFFDPSVSSVPRNKVDPKNSIELVNIKKFLRILFLIILIWHHLLRFYWVRAMMWRHVINIFTLN